MDKMLKPLKEVKELFKFKGTVSEMLELRTFTEQCRDLGIIPSNVKPSMLPKDDRHEFIDYLSELTHKFVLKKKIDSWTEFTRHPDSIKISKLLFEFGVRGEVFPLEEEGKTKPVEEEKKLTFHEFYELCQIKFNYDGSFGSFKKMISRKYGSFAEYCLSRGYDINNTKWECHETAVRVAQKIGSVDLVKTKSSSLFKYLLENDLLDEAFDQKAG